MHDFLSSAVKEIPDITSLSDLVMYGPRNLLGDLPLVCSRKTDNPRLYQQIQSRKRPPKKVVEGLLDLLKSSTVPAPDRNNFYVVLCSMHRASC